MGNDNTGRPRPYYQDDFVTLYLGDCLEITAWLQADVLVTDPPYGIEWKGITTGVNKGYEKHKAGIRADFDTQARDDVLELWGDRPAIVFGTWKKERPKKTVHRLIWHKAGMPPGPLNAAFMTQDEEIYILGSGFIKTSPPVRSVIATSEHRSSEVKKIGHPTPKPLDLMELLVSRCPPGIIADPFAGSGATLIAARNLGRQAIGVEYKKEYCDIIVDRLNQQAFQFEGL